VYIERFPGLQVQLHAYQEQTRNLELAWRMPAPVPTVQRSKWYDYYFTWANFEAEEVGKDLALAALFSMNPARKPDLRDPRTHMLVLAPYGSIDDAVVIFHSHIDEKEMGRVSGIRVIKGIKAELPEFEKEVSKFNFLLNRELAILFALAARDAQTRTVLDTELHLSFLEGVTFGRA
jgi:hypothetical protein